jgi:flavin reductase (DIM6/NTAB) family NADH-FMN oxidoreductase RutF
MTTVDHDALDRATRRALWLLQSPLVVVVAGDGRRDPAAVRAMTANWVQQVATEPRVVGVSMEAESQTLAAARAGGRVTISLLGEVDRPTIRRFVKPTTAGVQWVGEAATLATVPVTVDGDGAVTLSSAVGAIFGTVRGEVDLGSHILVLLDVLRATADDDVQILSMGDTKMHYGG